jgi:transposase
MRFSAGFHVWISPRVAIAASHASRTNSLFRQQLAELRGRLGSGHSSEPLRASCRLQSLRGWSHVKHIEEVFAEVRERAVQLVFDHQREHESQWAAIVSVAAKIGCTPETLPSWVRRAEVDEGRLAGVSSDELARLKELERENRELRRTDEILKSASVFFATELDGRTRRWAPTSMSSAIASGSSRSAASCSLPRAPTTRSRRGRPRRERCGMLS